MARREVRVEKLIKPFFELNLSLSLCLSFRDYVYYSVYTCEHRDFIKIFMFRKHATIARVRRDRYARQKGIRSSVNLSHCRTNESLFFEPKRKRRRRETFERFEKELA